MNNPTITTALIPPHQPLATLIMLTLDRAELTERITRQNIALSGVSREQLQVIIIDNASSDKRTIDIGQALADIHIANNVNLGVAKGQNMGLVRATGEYIALLGNDIELPHNWLTKAMQVASSDNTGLVGFDCLAMANNSTTYVNGLACVGGDVFGSVVFNRERVLSKVGYMCNAYGVYGLEDRDYLTRVQDTGLVNYYLRGMPSHHAAPDVGQDSEYRRTKDSSLKANAEVFTYMQQWYAEYGVCLPPDNFGFSPLLGRCYSNVK